MHGSKRSTPRAVAGAFAALLGALASCEKTTTPVSGPNWLPREKPAASATDAPSPQPASPPSSTAASERKPWDAPADARSGSILTPPTAAQMTECLAGATWILLEEQGTRRRSLRLDADGTFVASSNGTSGERPAFEGLVVQAKGRWTAKSDELRLTPSFGDPVVVRLQWLGDRRLIMFNGEQWIRQP
jgi:hypothetical protein